MDPVQEDFPSGPAGTVRGRDGGRPKKRDSSSGKTPPPSFTHEQFGPSLTPLEHDHISRLAYFYWEARGGTGGSAEDDWFRAERELWDHEF
jgi:hypothetical protein